MATQNYDLFTLQSNHNKRQPSSTAQIAFLAISVGTDSLTISEISSTAFGFGGAKLSSIANGVASTDAAALGQVLLLSGAQAMAASLNMGSNTLTNLANPVNPGDGVNLQTMQSYLNGNAWKDPAATISTATLPANTYSNGSSGVGATLTGNVNGAFPTTNGVAASLNMRIIVNAEATGANNGLYFLSTVGDGSNPYVLTRTLDADTAAELDRASLFVDQGSFAGYEYSMNVAAPFTVGTTALSFANTGTSTPVSYGNGLLLSGGTVSVVPADASLVATPGNLSVQEDAAGAIVTGGSGIKVQVDSNTMRITSNALAVNYAQAYTNGDGVSHSANQFVWEGTAGHMNTVYAGTASLGQGSLFGVVQDSSIASSASGQYVTKNGDIIGGFSGLTINSPVFLHPTTAGSYQQGLTSYTAGMQVVQLGIAVSATQIKFDPQWLYEY